MALQDKHLAIWDKAVEDEAYRKKLIANPVTELKKEGYTDIPDDLKISLKDGKLTFDSSDKLALGKLNARVTKSK